MFYVRFQSASLIKELKQYAHNIYDNSKFLKMDYNFDHNNDILGKPYIFLPPPHTHIYNV